MALSQNEVGILLNALDKAHANPYITQQIVLQGFAFLLHWSTHRSWYEGVVLYSPEYSGSTHIYGGTKEEFFDAVERVIKDLRITYKNGGHYPADYFQTRRRMI